MPKDSSPPPSYKVGSPSFEMRWPGPQQQLQISNGSALQPPAFQLTSHKQLEQADHIEEVFEESDESPPYLPSTIKPSAPPLPQHEGQQVVVNEKPV